MNELKVFQYEGSDMTFQLSNGDIMVNATQMAKPFGKKTFHFTENEQTRRFVSVLDSKLGIPSLKVIKGGNNSGTWMHQKLALKFAGWLSPEFELWVYDRIEELLKTGTTSIKSMSRKDLALMVIQAEEEKEKLQLENQKLKPKAQLVDKILDSDQQIDIGQAAKILELGFGRNKLFKELRERGVFFKTRNEPKQIHITKGYFRMTEKWIEKNNHDGFVVTKVLVTQKGLDFLAKEFGVVDKEVSLIENY